LVGIHLDPFSFGHRLAEALERSCHFLLDFSLLVAFLTETASLLGDGGGYTKEEDEVGSGEADIGRSAP
jgi:hypothetical protein